MNKINQLNCKKLKKVLATSAVLGTLTLTGCSGREISADVENVYDNFDLEEGTKQVLDVPGEEFKLIVEYSFDLQSQTEWTITAPKKMHTKVYTEGLNDDIKVYIDNVHTDVSTISDYTTMNGILQDTMDDRIHNSLMLGFPISDEIDFQAINQIEGQNDTFISGSISGFNGYTSGSVEQQRFEEADYLEHGVYGSLISSSYGLLIQKGDNTPYGVDVDSTLIVYADNEIEVRKNNDIITYRYDRQGKKEEVSKVKVKSK